MKFERITRDIKIMEDLFPYDLVSLKAVSAAREGEYCFKVETVHEQVFYYLADISEEGRIALNPDDNQEDILSRMDGPQLVVAWRKFYAVGEVICIEVLGSDPSAPLRIHQFITPVTTSEGCEPGYGDNIRRM